MSLLNEFNQLPFSLILGLTILTSPATLAAKVESGVSTRPNDILSNELHPSKESFEYQLEGRPDPFRPFISDQATVQRINADDIIDDDATQLTGMRQFEPGQLTLVAVMHTNKRALAMVEDVTGKGYILSEGMLIGRRGKIKQINDEQVTVIETAHTRAGRKLENTIVMRLNKEGDK